MGYRFAEKCYSTTAEAMSAYIGEQTLFVQPGATTYINQIEYDTATATYRFKSYTAATNGLWTLKANIGMPTPGFPVCNVMDQFNDGVTVGWLMFAILAAAFAIKTIKRGL